MGLTLLLTLPPHHHPQANIADHGDNQWVTCFQESAEAILGQNAAYLGQLKDSVRPFLLNWPGHFNMRAHRLCRSAEILTVLCWFHAITEKITGVCFVCLFFQRLGIKLLLCFAPSTTMKPTLAEKNGCDLHWIWARVCLSISERDCLWWSLPTSQLQHFCLPQQSEARNV